MNLEMAVKSSAAAKISVDQPLKARPFIKWVGGKRQLLPKILSVVPRKFNRYYEPFVGGGALFFELQPARAVLGDYNEELINAYRVVRDNPDELLRDLKRHKNDSVYFYKIRALDRNPKKYKSLSDVQRASRLIYLNKTGYNGLYRVNSKGQFNVPFGKYEDPLYADERIRDCSVVLAGSELLCGDFEETVSSAKKGDFVYFDPPYAPLNSTSNFTSYTDQKFDDEMQLRLKLVCDDLHKRGVKFALSNSHTKEMVELYADYEVRQVMAARLVNSRASGRSKIKEILVTNY